MKLQFMNVRSTAISVIHSAAGSSLNGAEARRETKRSPSNRQLVTLLCKIMLRRDMVQVEKRTYAHWRAMLAAMVLLALSVLPVNAQTSKDSALPTSFYSGDLRLSYSLFGKGASGGKELLALYKRGQWAELVEAVVSKDFVVNTYYFYLGRAAEELGHPTAALKYYQLAIDSPKLDTCTNGGMWDTCAGFVLPAEAIQRRESLLSTVSGPIGKVWSVGDGPTLTQLNLPPPESISDASTRTSPGGATQVQRGKFESEEEYRNRQARPKTRLLVLAVPTSDDARCKTTYDHSTGTYKVAGCIIASAMMPTLVETTDGEPIVLSNAFDQRTVRRVMYRQYQLAAAISWSAEYKLSAQDAAALEPDLLAGIEVAGLEVKAECSSCDMRDSIDKLDSLSESLSAVTGKRRQVTTNGWKDVAFKTGVVDEFWNYSLHPTKVLRFVVFRKSDQMVLYERIFN